VSSDINVIVLSGRLGADGETKVMGNGETVLKLRVAVNETWAKKDGPKQERTDWFAAELFGRRADALAKFMTKGTGVIISGRLRAEKVGEGAASKSFYTVRVNELSFTGSKGESRQQSVVPEATSQKPQHADLDDSDPLPF
jgi:single-strand DNA-binding protein